MAIDLNHKFALLETGEVEPLFYEDGDPRQAYEEDGEFYLCHDVYFDVPGTIKRGWALCRDKIIATSDNEGVLVDMLTS